MKGKIHYEANPAEIGHGSQLQDSNHTTAGRLMPSRQPNKEKNTTRQVSVFEYFIWIILQ
jgi:hypothetical protein